MAAARCRRANKGRLMRSAAGGTRSAAAKREGLTRKWEGWALGRGGLLLSGVESFGDFDGDSSASVEVRAVVVHG